MTSRVTRSKAQAAKQAEAEPEPEPEQQSRVRWTNGLTKILADLMVAQVQRGNRLNNRFTQKAWKLMCDEFYQKTGLKWDGEHLKKRYAVLKRQHAIVKALLSRRGFYLDQSSGAIIAKNDVWAEFIKENPDAESIRSNGCQLYKQLGVIFSEPLTNGEHNLSTVQQSQTQTQTTSSVPPKEPLSTIQQESSSSESEEADDTADDQDFKPYTPSTAVTATGAAAATAATGAASRKRGRKGVDDAIAGAILHMAAASKLRTAAVKHICDKYSISDCIKQLDEMHVGEELYFAALDLFNNRIAREIFLSLKGDKRLIWLRGKCTGLPLP